MAPIAQQANALFPSLYTFYTDPVGWQKYAIANIAEARRIAPGKPVYVFLWPQYDDGTGAQVGDYLPDAYWKMELETAKQYADGVVIWGGWTHTWDSNASWWLTTQEFITEIRANYAIKGIQGCQGECPQDNLTTASDAAYSPLQYLLSDSPWGKNQAGPKPSHPRRLHFESITYSAAQSSFGSFVDIHDR